MDPMSVYYAQRAPVPEPRRHGPGGKAMILALLVLALFALPFLPDAIRITLPDRWFDQIPRIEFVRHGSPEDEAATAQAPPPAPAAPALADSSEREAAPVAKKVAPKPKPRPRKVKRTPPPAPVEEEPEEEEEAGLPLWPDRSATYVPMRVTTSVELARGAPRPASTPAPPAESVPEASWPLLCVEVVDSAGVGLEGVRVDLVSPPLSVRTDRRGRFCLACPPGPRTLQIAHPGYAPVTRDLSLSAATLETRIPLSPAR